MEHEILGLYLPTHRDEGQTINRVRKNIEIMDRILHKLNKDQSRKVLMFYRLHPYDEHLGEQIPKYRYVFRTPEFIDSYELMASVDFLVSDYSSVIFDFAYLRRPIIGFIPDEREYKEKCRDLYLKPSDVYETCCHCEEELSRALQYVTNNTDNNVSICGINPKIFLPSQRAGTLCCMTLNAIEKELS
jgi:CDP-glycerol glycerophosphotransferase (TagB/SpsB family)